MGFVKKMMTKIPDIILSLCKVFLGIFLVFYICSAFECSQGRSILELINRLDEDCPWVMQKNAVEELEEMGETIIDDLFYALKHKNKHIRRAIPGILSGINSPAVKEPLIYTLEDPDDEVAENAADAFYYMFLRDGAVEPLIYLLEKGNDSIKIKALGVIGKIAGYKRREEFGGEVLELDEKSTLRRAIIPVTALLKEKNPMVRLTALWVLRRMRDPAPAAFVIPLLKDRKLNVRIAAIETLGILGGEQSNEPLIELLDDTNWRIRMEASMALGRLKNKQAVEPLIERLKDREWRVQYRAIISLGILQDERAVVPLIETFEREKSLIIKRLVVIALGEIGRDGGAVDFLGLLLYHGDSDIREIALNALGKIGKPAVEILLKTLKRTDKYADYFREHVITAFGNISDPRAFEPLVRALEHDSSEVRRSAVTALGRYNDSRAFDVLLTVLRDKDGVVRGCALRVLVEAKYCRAYKAVKRLSETDRDRFVRDNAKQAVKNMERVFLKDKEHFPDGKVKIENRCKCTEEGELLIERRFFNNEDKLIKDENLVEHIETRYTYFPGFERDEHNRAISEKRLEKIFGEWPYFYCNLLQKGLRMIEEYKNGQYHGRVIEWDREGFIRKEEIWENGKLVKKKK